MKAMSSDCKFYYRGQELELTTTPKMQITGVVEGDYSNNYNYKISGKCNLSIKAEAEGGICKIEGNKYFCCMIKVKDEDVKEINRIDISDIPC